jgi:hypothetical protein
MLKDTCTVQQRNLKLEIGIIRVEVFLSRDCRAALRAFKLPDLPPAASS